MAPKNPKTKANPQLSKTPRKGYDENPLHLKPAWRVGYMEMCDPFGWHQTDAATLLQIREKLRSFESMTLGEILGPNNHMVPIHTLCKEARDRVAVLHLDDIDELLSLRLGATERIWGILEHNIVTLLWWDPDHCVCLSVKKRT